MSRNPTDAAAIAAAVTNARNYVESHPEEAVSSDPAATAVLGSGLRTTVTGPKGWRLETGMAKAVGGDGQDPSPGWVLRAALASCDIVLVAMQAAEEGVAISRLDSEVVSESDDRGLLGIGDAPAGPMRVRTTITIAADGLDAAAARALVERALKRSPVADAVKRAVPVDVEVVA